jgi:hypothetical protein
MTNRELALLQAEHKVVDYLEKLVVHDRNRLLRMMTHIKSCIIEQDSKMIANLLIDRAKEK